MHVKPNVMPTDKNRIYIYKCLCVCICKSIVSVGATPMNEYAKKKLGEEDEERRKRIYKNNKSIQSTSFEVLTHKIDAGLSGLKSQNQIHKFQANTDPHIHPPTHRHTHRETHTLKHTYRVLFCSGTA